MFDLERFVADCKAAHAADPSHKAVREVLACALQEPGSVLKGLGEPARAQIGSLYRSAGLTILNVVWAPGMSIYPHDHRMWAIIGIYEGREDNAFFRRETPRAPTLTESGGKRLSVGDVLVLGDNKIHGVTNPLDNITGAIHVYGGDLVAHTRPPDNARSGRPPVRWLISGRQRHHSDQRFVADGTGRFLDARLRRFSGESRRQRPPRCRSSAAPNSD